MCIHTFYRAHHLERPLALAKKAFELEILKWSEKGKLGSFRKVERDAVLARIWSREKRKWVNKHSKIWKITIESGTITGNLRAMKLLVNVPIEPKPDTEATHLRVFVPIDVLNNVKPSKLQNPERDEIYRFYIRFQVDDGADYHLPNMNLVLSGIEPAKRTRKVPLDPNADPRPFIY